MSTDCSTLTHSIEIEADAVVIGSGAGGAVVARELAEAGKSVVLCEEGAHFTKKDFTQRPIEMFAALYRNAGMTGTIGRPSIVIPLGKTVGGTTTINSGTCFRVPEAVVETWRREHGLESISYGDLAPIFDRVEKILHVGPARWEIIGKNALVVKRGFESLGWNHGRLIRNALESCEGYGVCCFGCPDDAKRPMHLSYIPPAERAGAQLFARCRVTRLLREGGRVAGLVGEALDPQGRPTGRTVTVRARNTVLSAGAVLSPVFLRRQGIRDAGGHLGRHLTVHPATRVVALFDEIIDGWQGVPQSYYSDHLHDRGIMLETIHGPISLLGPTLPRFGPDYVDTIDAARRLGSLGVMISDETQGVVRPGIGDAPLITYAMVDADVRKVIEGICAASEVLFAAGAREVYPPFSSVPVLRDRREVERLRTARIPRDEFELMAFHPLGTCRMGRDERRGVVDPDGRVWGVKDLWIADGSIFPTSLGVNPQETIMAFATRIARKMLD